MKIKVVTNSIIPKVLGVSGITIYPYIFLKAETIDMVILSHEFVHIAQVERLGWFKFHVTYFYNYFVNRAKGLNHDQAYRQNEFEVEAYRDERLAKYLATAEQYRKA